MAKVLGHMFVEVDYSVWDSEYNLKLGEMPWMDQINDAIFRCIYKGFYVLIISEHSIQSKHTETELKFATSQGAWIVPVVVGNPDMPEWKASWSGRCYRCTENPAEEDFVGLLKEIDRVMLYKIRNLNAQIDTE